MVADTPSEVVIVSIPGLEQLTGVLHALPELTASERAGLAMALNGQSYQRLPPTLNATPKAASQAAYRARRKLAAALAQAA